MLRILSIETTPFHVLPFLNVSSGRKAVRELLPFLRGEIQGLPDQLDALLVAADLQGRARCSGPSAATRLLGERVAECAEELSAQGVIPATDRIGVMLAGDFYCREGLDKRGGSGDVRSVWAAFARRFRWVAGVAGNHDLIGERDSKADLLDFKQQPGIHFLDGDLSEADGLMIAGLSGVVGNPERPFRRTEPAFNAITRRLAELGPDILVMHDGPQGDEHQVGWPSVRLTLESVRATLVIRGHAYWKEPLAVLTNGTQILSADSRVVLLGRAQ